MSRTVIFTQNLGAFEIDVTLEETHHNSLTVTRFPVENGSPLSDHAQINPKLFDLVAGVSDMKGGWSPGRVQAAFETLKGVQEMRQPLTVVSGLTVLQNMLIEDFTVTQDKDTAHVLIVRAHLTEVKRVGTKTTTALRPQNTSEQGTGFSGTFSLEEEATENKAKPLVERGDVGLPLEEWCWDCINQALGVELPSLGEEESFISSSEKNRLIELSSGGFGG